MDRLGEKMRILMIAIAGSVFCASAALADDPMAGAYGNTITVTNPKGETTKIVISEDKSYQTTLPDGNVHKGIWALNPDQTQICFTQQEPALPSDAQPACGVVRPGKKAGDQWEEGEGDAKRMIAIVPGS